MVERDPGNVRSLPVLPAHHRMHPEDRNRPVMRLYSALLSQVNSGLYLIGFGAYFWEELGSD